MPCYNRGSVNAPIMMIGQSPGKGELTNSKKIKDKNNKDKEVIIPVPFCGPAGVKLQEIINWLGLDEGSYFLTNIDKIGNFNRPGMKGPKPPSEDQMLNQRNELIKEITKVDPKLIMTLGKEALWVLCYYNKVPADELFIGRNVGKYHNIKIEINKHISHLKDIDKNIVKNYEILPLYHPSALLRESKYNQGSSEIGPYHEKMIKTLNENKQKLRTLTKSFMI